MQTYLNYCRTCKAQTANIIIKISRAHGVKIRCLKCGNVSKYYINFNKLVEIEE